MNEHDRRILADKNKPADDREALGEFARTHWFCQNCGRTDLDFQRHTIHHLIGGRGGRADEPCNLLYLCWQPCHMLAEGLDVQSPDWGKWDYASRLLPKLTLGIQISLKLRIGELDAAGLARLAVLHGRTLPDAEPIPRLFVALFQKNRPELVGRTWPILASTK